MRRKRSKRSKRKRKGPKKKLRENIEERDAYHLFYKPYLYITDLSSIEAIYEHAKAVNKTVLYLKKMFDAYLEGDFNKAHKIHPEVKESEFEADNIKSIIRDKLPRRFFSDLTKDDMNAFLKELDAVADSAEDVADILAARRTIFPKEVKKDFKKHSEIVHEAMAILFDIIKGLDKVVKRVFRKKDVDRVLQRLHRVGMAEHEADKIKFAVRKKIFNLKDSDPLEVYHMLKIIELSDNIVNHAENVEGRIRIIVSQH